MRNPFLVIRVDPVGLPRLLVQAIGAKRLLDLLGYVEANARIMGLPWLVSGPPMFRSVNSLYHWSAWE